MIGVHTCNRLNASASSSIIGHLHRVPDRPALGQAKHWWWSLVFMQLCLWQPQSFLDKFYTVPWTLPSILFLHWDPTCPLAGRICWMVVWSRQELQGQWSSPNNVWCYQNCCQRPSTWWAILDQPLLRPCPRNLSISPGPWQMLMTWKLVSTTSTLFNKVLIAWQQYVI